MRIEKVSIDMKKERSGLVHGGKATVTKALQKAALGLLLIGLVGCSADPAVENDYEKDTSPGKKVEVPLAQIAERQNNGEKMLVLFEQDACSYCAAFDEVVDEYIQNHNIELNVVNLTTEEAHNSKEDITKVLNAVVGGVEQTPALYYIESKENVYLLDYSNGEYTIDSLSKFVEKHQLDRLEEDAENAHAGSNE